GSGRGCAARGRWPGCRSTRWSRGSPRPSGRPPSRGRTPDEDRPGELKRRSWALLCRVAEAAGPRPGSLSSVSVVVRPPRGPVGSSADRPVHVLLRARAGGRVRDPGAVAGGVDDALLQPGVGAGQDAPDDLAVEVVGVGPQAAEEFLDPDAGLAAEGVRELVRLAAVLAPAAQQFGADAGGAHGEQFGADVDDPAEEALLGLHLPLPAGHGVEGGAGQLAGGALDVAQVR